MNPLEIRARNFRTYDELELSLPGGCTAIVGANGAGKSSLLTILELALFGDRNLGAYLADDADDDTLELELVFEHRQQTYRVRRWYSARGRGSSKTDFEQHVFSGANAPSDAPGGWETLTRETQAATQALIEETIALSRETLRASALLMQGDGAAFTEATPAQRKEILAEILNLGQYEAAHELVHADRGKTLHTIEAARDRVAALDDELAKREDVVRELEAANGEALAADAAAAKADAEASDLVGQLAAAQAHAAKLGAATEIRHGRRTLLHSIENRRVALRKERQLLDVRVAGRAELERQAATVEALEAELESRRQAWEDHRVALEKIGELARDVAAKTQAAQAAEVRRDAAGVGLIAAKGLLEDLELGEVEVCSSCGQALVTEEARAKHRAEIVARIEAARAASDETEAEYQAAIGALGAAERAQAEAVTPEAPASIAAAQAAAEAARRAATQLAAIEEAGRRLEAVNAELETSEVEMNDAGRALDEAHAEVERIGDLPTPVAELEARIAGYRALIAAHRQESGEARRRAGGREAELDALGRQAGERDRLVHDVERELVLSATLGDLEQAFGRDGIPTLILENAAIPQIELEAGRILAELGGETGACRFELRTQRALKRAEGVRETLDIFVIGPNGERLYETYSGGERTRLNLALRIALARLLANRRGAEVRLLAIDEPEFLDEEGVGRLADVLRGLDDDFERTFLISHMPALRDAFDQTLEVVRREDGRSEIHWRGGEGVPAEAAA